MAEASFRVLGPVVVRLGDREVDAGQPRQRAVLAALLVDAGRPVSTDTLITRVWGERPPDGARRALHSHLSRVRQALADGLLHRGPGGYLLDIDADRVDLHRFRRLVRGTQQLRRDDPRRAAQLRDALALWTGEPLAGVPGEWASAQRDDWTGQRVEATVRWAAAELAQGNAEVTVGPLTELTAGHPTHEPLAEALMSALRATGRTAEALKRYEHLRQRLAEELGIDPSPSAQRLHVGILRNTAAAPAELTVPRQLPLYAPGFSGRAGELAQLDRFLADPDCTIAAIEGAAGTGKTALALHWAHRVADRFRDGQLYVNLSGYAPGPPLAPASALGGMLRALGTPPDRVPEDLSEAAALYRSLLAGRRVLVVLDNALSAEQVRPLLPGAVECAVLVTSRERLDGLVAREGARRLPLSVLPEPDAAALLTAVVGADRAAAEPDEVRELVRLCGALPLALRVVAADLTAHRLRRIADAVATLRGGPPLRELRLDGDESAGVRRAFDLSYRAIPADARRLFRLLSLVPGPSFTAGAAAAVSGVAPSASGRLLDRLARGHLVEEPAAHRYAFHDLVRQYAAERSEAEDTASERTAARDRLFAWYTQQVVNASNQLNGEAILLPGTAPSAVLPDRPAGQWRGLLEAERANLVAAVHQATRDGAHRCAVRLADAMRRDLHRSGSTADWRAVAEAGLASARALRDPVAESAGLTSLAQLEHRLGNSARAIAQVTAAAELAGRHGWALGHAAMLGNLGGMLLESGRPLAATPWLRRALRVGRAAGSRMLEAYEHGNLAACYRLLGRLSRSARHARRALELFQERAPLGSNVAIGHNVLGRALVELGDHDAAAVHLHAAYDLTDAMGHRHSQTFTATHLSALYLARGDHVRALRYAVTAVDLALDAVDGGLVAARAYGALAAVHAAAGDDRAAVLLYGRAHDRAVAVKDRFEEVSALLGLARLHLRGQRPGDARAPAADALRLAREGAFATLLGEAHIVLAAVDLAEGLRAEAAEHGRRALRYHRAAGHRLGQRAALLALARSLDEPAAVADARRRLALLTTR